MTAGLDHEKDLGTLDRIEQTIRDNLMWRIKTVGGQVGEIEFNDKPPERNDQSHKFIRVVRNF